MYYYTGLQIIHNEWTLADQNLLMSGKSPSVVGLIVQTYFKSKLFLTNKGDKSLPNVTNFKITDRIHELET